MGSLGFLAGREWGQRDRAGGRLRRTREGGCRQSYGSGRRQKEDRGVSEEPTGARGLEGSPRFLKQRGRPAPLPGPSGRFTEPVSACLHSPKGNLGSQFR